MQNRQRELNPRSPIPLYRQLADILSEDIRSGVYPSGARIPSEVLLARKYGIGRPTVRQATESLIRKGMVTRRRGAGTFVVEEAREVDLFSLDGTLAAFEKKGVALITAILHPMGMIPVSGAPENPFNDGEAYYFSRVSRADGRPVLIEDIYLHPVLFSGIDRFDLTGRSLSQAVEERFYLRPTGGRQLFRVDYPTRDQAKLLSVSVKTPILAVRRFLNFSGCENGVYAELFCRTDQYVFSQVIGG